MSESDIAAIRARWQPLFDAEERAKLLISSVPSAHLFIAIENIELSFASFDIVDDLITIRKVTNPPDLLHVAQAATERTVALPVGRYSSYITAEFAIGNPEIREDERGLMLELAWHTMALLKLRGYINTFCPAAATCSWDVISGQKDAIEFQVLDDVPRQIRLPITKTAVDLEDIRWVKDYWDNTLTLRDRNCSRRFELAFDIMFHWNHTSDLRAAIALVWAGIESLFGERTDQRISAALAQRISSWIPKVSQKEAMELYNHRCDAVHGRELSQDLIIKILDRSYFILKESLIKSIETKSITLPDWS